MLSSSPASTRIHRKHPLASYALDKIDACHTKHRYMLVKVTHHTQHIPHTQIYTYQPLYHAVHSPASSRIHQMHPLASYALDKTYACHTKHRYMLVKVTQYTQHIPHTQIYTQHCTIMLSSSPASTRIHQMHPLASYALDQIDACHTEHRCKLVKVTHHT